MPSCRSQSIPMTGIRLHFMVALASLSARSCYLRPWIRLLNYSDRQNTIAWAKLMRTGWSCKYIACLRSTGIRRGAYSICDVLCNCYTRPTDSYKNKSVRLFCKLDFLGFRVSAAGNQRNPPIEAIRRWPLPLNCSLLCGR